MNTEIQKTLGWKVLVSLAWWTPDRRCMFWPRIVISNFPELKGDKAECAGMLAAGVQAEPTAFAGGFAPAERAERATCEHKRQHSSPIGR